VTVSYDHAPRYTPAVLKLVTLTATAFMLLIALACGTPEQSPRGKEVLAPLPTLKPAPPLIVQPSPTLAPAVPPTSAAGVWVQLASRPARRVNFHAEPLPDGRILIFGGSGNEGPILTSEIFDPVSNEWSESGEMIHAITAQTLPIRLSNGHILVVDSTNSRPTDQIQIYNPESGEWSVTGPLNTPRYASTGAPLSDGGALIIGGADQQAIPQSSAERFNAKTNTWEEVTSSPLKQRYVQASILLDNGSIALIGEGPTLSNKAAIYDPNHDSWSETAPMNVARRGAAVWALEGEHVLVVGGFTGSKTTLESEIYDSTTDEWTSIADVPGRASALGVLSDGRPIGIGSEGATNQPVLLIYDPDSDTWDAEQTPLSPDGNGDVTLTADDWIFTFAAGNEFLGITPETWAYKVPVK